MVFVRCLKRLRRAHVMSRPAVLASVVMFAASFLMVAAVYHALPPVLPILRNPFGGLLTTAPTTVFTAFRIPLMNLSHGLMAAVMVSRTRDFTDERRQASYFALFSTLLFAIALKADFEALGLAGLVVPGGWLSQWATVGTVLSVMSGLTVALVRARGAALPWPELRVPAGHKITLACLLVAYLAMVAASLRIAYAG
jgi:hypothetical protein